MYSEFATDPKVQMLPEAMQRRLVMLFCMRCGDVTVTLGDAEIAFHLRISDTDLAETKALFIAKGFIDSKWNIKNWEKRQFSSDSSAARTRAYRDRKRDKVVTSQVTNSGALDTDTDTDTEKEEEANASLSTAAPQDDESSVDGDSGDQQPARPACPHQRIVALYHEVLPELRQVRDWNETRRKLLQRRWAEEFGRQNLDWWRGYFEYIRGSDFLMGKTTGRDGRPFDCDLEWLVRPSNFAKVIEGKYENDA
ncbi:hypothetical protein [Stenotrophomonas humi]|nr:hypothetical protein [Stenotrophomonas humi]